MNKNSKRQTTIAKRQQADKDALIEVLKKTPIIQAACQKLELGRATYYRWLKEDPAFAEAVHTALDHGVGLVNDMAESQLISAIKDKHMTAIIFWLKHHHQAYTTRVEVTTGQSTELPTLDEEQQKVVQAALEQAKLLADPSNDLVP